MIYVFLGGGLGSLCRYGIAKALQPYHYTFPYATLLANILSCIVLGFFVAWSLREGRSENVKLFFMVGFCGGFSTFSTFSNETFQLLQNGHYAYGLANIAVSVLVCLVAIYVGIKIGEMFLSV